MIKVTFIGTGNMKSRTRANNSILVDDLLFDCGMGTVKQIERLGYNTKDINYVVISHFHPDHILDIQGLILARRIRNETVSKLYIIGPVGLKEVLNKLVLLTGSNDIDALAKQANLEFIELTPNETVSLGETNLTAYEVDHGDMKPSYGYLLEKADKVIGYSGDTVICDNLHKMSEKADYMLVDAHSLETRAGRHATFKEVKDLADKYPNCQFYAIHRSDYEVKDPGKVNIPIDGDIINIKEDNQ